MAKLTRLLAKRAPDEQSIHAAVSVDELRVRLREIAHSKLPREGIKNLLAELA